MAPSRKAPPRPRWPWDAVELELHEIAAIKAIPEPAFKAIEKICVGFPFTAGGEDGRRATDFGCGKLWVGNTLRQIREMTLPARPNSPPRELPNSPTPATEAKD